MNSKPVTKIFSEKDIEGSKYRESSFEIAEIYVNEKLYKKYAIIYNAYNDEIEVKSDNNNFVLSKEEYISVVKKTYKYVYYNHNQNKGYFVVFNKGEIALLLKAKKKIKKAVEPKSGLGSYVPPKFINDYKYFIRNERGTLRTIKLKKKDILKVLGDKKEEVSKFVSSKKLSFKKEKDVIKIIDFYNTL